MKLPKFLLSNLFIGAVVGAILSGPFFLIWNLLANKFSAGSIDIITTFIIVVPICMIVMSVVLRSRLHESDNKK